MAEDVKETPTSTACQLKGNTVNETRIEEDLLGSKEVPIGAYYGIHTVRALENFKISSAKISDVPEMVRGMVHMSLFAMAEAFLTMTIPRTISGTSLIVAELILKFSKARTVCMP